MALILFMTVSSWLQNQVDNQLLLTAAQVSSMLHDVEEPNAPIDVEELNFLFTEANVVTESFLREQMFFARLIHRASGMVITSSTNYQIPIVQQILSSEARFDTVDFERPAIADTPIRIYTLPLSYAPEFALQVGVSLASVRAVQGGMLQSLVLLFSTTAILALLTGWFLATRALIPIRATAQTAAEINATDLTRRLNLADAEIELEQLVQTFNAMLNRLELAFQRQRQFTADAAHELRTPLSIMQTGLDVTLSQERGAADYRAALQSVSEEVQRLTQLTNTLLILARADKHELPLDKQCINLTQILETVVEQFIIVAQEKQIHIQSEIAPNLVIEGDEVRLIQVIFNVLDNAVKYTPQAGSIFVRAFPQRNLIEIQIEDTGSGILPSEQPYIFERFYRVDITRNRNQGGFGLGLAIAKEIVELHNGTIAVVSVPNQGALFSIRLPLR